MAEQYLLQEDGLKGGIKGLAHVLQQHSPPEPNSVLQRPQKIFIHRLDNIEAALALQVANPAVRLALGVNHERPSARLGHNDACIVAPPCQTTACLSATESLDKKLCPHPY